MKFSKMALLLAVTASMSVYGSEAYAFGLGDVAGSVTGGASGGGAKVDVDGLLSQGKGLMGKFNSAISNMTAAEAQTMKALGLQAEGDKLLAVSKNYASGNVQSSDQVDRDVQLSVDASKAIDEKIKENGKLDAASKKNLAIAVPFFAKGIAESAGLPGEFKNWATTTQSGIASLTSNPTDAMKLKDGALAPLQVAQNLPSLVSSFGQTTKNFVSFAQGNGLDVKSVSSAIGD